MMSISTTPAKPTRRRFLQISAAAMGSALAPKASAVSRQVWYGQAMGADISIELAGLPAPEAEALLSQCRQMITHLEGLFSLYQPQSAINKLNRTGRIARPAPEMVALLDLSQHISKITDGAFDITVQPLWQMYKEHFSCPSPNPEKLTEKLAKAHQLVDWRTVQVTPELITLHREGAAITLNGIAQGFATDKIVTLLKENGVENTLVNIGEYYGLGHGHKKQPWPITIAHPQTGYIQHLTLKDKAIATSGAYGLLFERSGKHHHLLDPRTGKSANLYTSMSVLHDSAAMADGLSTAFYTMKKNDVIDLASTISGIQVIALHQNGQRFEI